MVEISRPKLLRAMRTSLERELAQQEFAADQVRKKLRRVESEIELIDEKPAGEDPARERPRVIHLACEMSTPKSRRKARPLRANPIVTSEYQEGGNSFDNAVRAFEGN